MKPQYIFPLILLISNIGASAVYFFNGDWRRGTYWAAAAIITWVVTF